MGSIKFWVSHIGGPQSFVPFPHNSYLDKKLSERMILCPEFTHSLVRHLFQGFTACQSMVTIEQ